MQRRREVVSARTSVGVGQERVFELRRLDVDLLHLSSEIRDILLVLTDFGQLPSGQLVELERLGSRLFFRDILDSETRQGGTNGGPGGCSHTLAGRLERRHHILRFLEAELARRRRFGSLRPEDVQEDRTHTRKEILEHGFLSEVMRQEGNSPRLHFNFPERLIAFISRGVNRHTIFVT